jgi:hypothetical protein
MITASQIQNNAPVVCSKDKQLGVVDHMEGAFIKLKKDEAGVHHYVPLSWVTLVDSKVHLDRPGTQAMDQWSKTPPVEKVS